MLEILLLVYLSNIIDSATYFVHRAKHLVMFLYRIRSLEIALVKTKLTRYKSLPNHTLILNWSRRRQ